MHLDFFRFNKDPFNASPDPEFLFMGASHMEALDSVLIATRNRKGFIVITGEAGVGKTAILRSYIERTDPERTRVIYLINAEISFDRLLVQMASKLGISGAEGAALEPSLLSRLESEGEEGKNVVLLIDEAQNMPARTLDLLRTFGETESSRGKLLQIVLVGQPELDKKLNSPELKELNKIISIRSRIHPMRPDESLAYIEFRLTKASSGHNPVFTNEALKQIVKEAGGIPRMINVICDNALMAAFDYQQSPVTGQIAKKAIRLFRGRQPGFSSSWKYVAVSSVIVLFAFCIAFLAWRSPWKIPLISKARTAASVVKEKSPLKVAPSNGGGKPSPNISPTALNSNREKPSANQLIASAKAQFTNDPAKAQKFLYQAIELEPANYEGHFQLGRLLTFKGDYEGAIREYRKALSIDDRIADIHFNLGYIYLRSGKYDRARDSYEKCLACSPSYKDEVLTNLGVVELKTGNRMKARGLFLKAIRLNPGDKLARKYLDWLDKAASN